MGTPKKETKIIRLSDKRILKVVNKGDTPIINIDNKLLQKIRELSYDE